METGKILITKTKKGFAGMLAYTKPNGQPGQMPILDHRFADDGYNDTECQFERDGGKLIKLIAHDGTALVDKTAYSPAAGGRSEEGPTDEFMTRTVDILDIRKTFLPRDIQDIAEHINRHGIDNFTLKLNKAAWHDGEGEKLKFYFYRQNKHKQGRDTLIHSPFHLAPITALAERQLRNARVLLPHISRQVFSPDWRLVVGLGGESVYETSMTLHHVYGTPYIPGSSVKGVVRSWIITNVFLPQIPEKAKDRSNKAEEKAWENKTFVDWFGNQDQAGRITFFDAFPTETPRIEPDVMNPHYQEYYSDNNGRKAPTDHQRTNPINFLTVSGSPFQFIIGARDKALLKEEKIGEKTISTWLKEALENHGIGAKTATGYGYFKTD